MVTATANKYWYESCMQPPSTNTVLIWQSVGLICIKLQAHRGKLSLMGRIILCRWLGKKDVPGTTQPMSFEILTPHWLKAVSMAYICARIFHLWPLNLSPLMLTAPFPHINLDILFINTNRLFCHIKPQGDNNMLSVHKRMLCVCKFYFWGKQRNGWVAVWWWYRAGRTIYISH